MGFWEGWWWSELTRPSKKEYIPDVEMNYGNLLRAKYEADKAYEEGIRTGYANEAKYQEGIQTGEGRKTAVKEQLQSSGFKGAGELIKAIDDGRVEVYSEDGYNKFRWAK